MIGSLLTNHGSYFWRDAANACRRHSGIYNSLVIPSGFHNLGISNKTSFWYPQTFIAWVSATKQASHTLKLSIAWVSATKQASDTLKLSTAWVSATKQAFQYPQTFIVWVSATKQAFHTHKLFIVWVSVTKQAFPTHKLFKAEEGYREACAYLLCPRWGGRRAQRSLILFPVPTFRRKKGTEKLAPISCAHAEVGEGYREAWSYLLCPHWGGRRVQRSLILSPVPTLRQKNGHRRNLSGLWQPYVTSHAPNS